jgi:hypothetical protein
LAIDENMTLEEANKYYKIYEKVYDLLNEKKIDSKKINQQIKIAYSTVHDRFLRKYNDNEYFSEMFKLGTYNCVTASMIYAMVFEQLSIPYKIMASTGHVYLIANPGPNSIVVETTNPGFEKMIFTGEFKKQYVSYLLNSKLISEEEYKNKSAEELFEANYNKVREVEFFNLPGIQYYNKAVSKMQKFEYEEAYKLWQKTYYFFPEDEIKPYFYNALLYLIERSNFDKVTDIDYVAQLARFENVEWNIPVGIFSNIINNKLQFTDKKAYCDSLFQRLSSKITDTRMLQELSFSYYMQMSYQLQGTNEVADYASNALKIKENHQDANIILNNFILSKLHKIVNSHAFLDTITKLKNEYNYSQALKVLKEQEMIAYLRIAGESFEQKNTKEGEKFLAIFEENCSLPIENSQLSNTIELTYRYIANYYNIRKYKTKAQGIVDQGLKYVPYSNIIRSAIIYQ